MGRFRNGKRSTAHPVASHSAQSTTSAPSRSRYYPYQGGPNARPSNIRRKNRPRNNANKDHRVTHPPSTCWNCDSKHHSVQECPEDIDEKRIDARQAAHQAQRDRMILMFSELNVRPQPAASGNAPVVSPAIVAGSTPGFVPMTMLVPVSWSAGLATASTATLGGAIAALGHQAGNDATSASSYTFSAPLSSQQTNQYPTPSNIAISSGTGDAMAVETSSGDNDPLTINMIDAETSMALDADGPTIPDSSGPTLPPPGLASAFSSSNAECSQLPLSKTSSTSTSPLSTPPSSQGDSTPVTSGTSKEPEAIDWKIPDMREHETQRGFTCPGGPMEWMMEHRMLPILKNAKAAIEDKKFCIIDASSDGLEVEKRMKEGYAIMIRGLPDRKFGSLEDCFNHLNVFHASDVDINLQFIDQDLLSKQLRKETDSIHVSKPIQEFYDKASDPSVVYNLLDKKLASSELPDCLKPLLRGTMQGVIQTSTLSSDGDPSIKETAWLVASHGLSFTPPHHDCGAYGTCTIVWMGHKGWLYFRFHDHVLEWLEEDPGAIMDELMSCDPEKMAKLGQWYYAPLKAGTGFLSGAGLPHCVITLDDAVMSGCHFDLVDIARIESTLREEAACGDITTNSSRHGFFMTFALYLKALSAEVRTAVISDSDLKLLCQILCCAEDYVSSAEGGPAQKRGRLLRYLIRKVADNRKRGIIDRKVADDAWQALRVKQEREDLDKLVAAGKAVEVGRRKATSKGKGKEKAAENEEDAEEVAEVYPPENMSYSLPRDFDSEVVFFSEARDRLDEIFEFRGTEGVKELKAYIRERHAHWKEVLEPTKKSKAAAPAKRKAPAAAKAPASKATTNRKTARTAAPKAQAVGKSTTEDAKKAPNRRSTRAASKASTIQGTLADSGDEEMGSVIRFDTRTLKTRQAKQDAVDAVMDGGDKEREQPTNLKVTISNKQLRRAGLTKPKRTTANKRGQSASASGSKPKNARQVERAESPRASSIPTDSEDESVVIIEPPYQARGSRDTTLTPIPEQEMSDRDAEGVTDDDMPVDKARDDGDKSGDYRPSKKR